MSRLFRRPCPTRLQQLVASALVIFFMALPCISLAEDEQDTFALNLNDADISVFIQTVSEITGFNFVIDPRVKGKVTVITSTPTSAERIYEIFLSTLEVNGYVAIPSGDVIKIVPDAGSSQRAPSAEAVQAEAGSDRLVTRIIEVQNLSVKQLSTTLKPLLPPTAYLAGHPEAKMLVITATAGNVQRLADIVARIDRASGQGIEIIGLRYADAAQVIETINSLDQQNMQKIQSPGGNIAAIVEDARSNSIVVSGPAEERARLRALIERLDVPADNLRAAQVIYLKHAEAVDLQKIIKTIGDKLLKTTGKNPQPFEVEADEATNALIVSAAPGLMVEVQSVIDKLDVPRAQVQVEGIIAEIGSGRATELGFEWKTAIPGSQAVYAISRPSLGGSATSSIPSGPGGGTAFPDVAGAGLSLGFFANGNLHALLKALATDSSSKILSTPTVVTLDNKKALIHIGKNVPILTGTFTTASSTTTDPFQTYERRDVGIKLEVTPQINEGDTVKLEIRQEVSTIDPDSTSTELITNERTIETTVQVNDGQIIALGGLISDEVGEQRSTVPLLGDLPLLGELFTSRRSTLDRRNLVVFLRPTILSQDGSQRVRLMENRYQRMREQQLGGAARNGEDIALMPGQRAATLPAYPPAPDQPIIDLAPPQSTGEAAEEDKPAAVPTYPFFDIAVD